jgi:hypothetical protein
VPGLPPVRPPACAPARLRARPPARPPARQTLRRPSPRCADCHGINAGMYFIRNTAWSHTFLLEVSEGQAQGMLVGQWWPACGGRGSPLVQCSHLLLLFWAADLWQSRNTSGTLRHLGGQCSHQSDGQGPENKESHQGEVAARQSATLATVHCGTHPRWCMLLRRRMPTPC